MIAPVAFPILDFPIDDLAIFVVIVLDFASAALDTPPFAESISTRPLGSSVFSILDSNIKSTPVWIYDNPTISTHALITPPPGSTDIAPPTADDTYVPTELKHASND